MFDSSWIKIIAIIIIIVLGRNEYLILKKQIVKAIHDADKQDLWEEKHVHLNKVERIYTRDFYISWRL